MARHPGWGRFRAGWRAHRGGTGARVAAAWFYRRVRVSLAWRASLIPPAFGARSISGTPTDPYSGFGAQYGTYSDTETGLQLLGYRYYDPAQGRFVNRDPIGMAG
ncbi:MAG: hypothetical protein KGK12_06310, partial [Armatimonadetes bacterium]|nr:hypothetical protein [Armatimonadota bacterium]